MPLLPAVGVKMAVRVRPVPERADSLPPMTLISPMLPSQEKVLPGSLEKEKVMLAVSPALRVPLSLEMERVGARLSKENLRTTLAGP